MILGKKSTIIFRGVHGCGLTDVIEKRPTEKSRTHFDVQNFILHEFIEVASGSICGVQDFFGHAKISHIQPCGCFDLIIQCFIVLIF